MIAPAALPVCDDKTAALRLLILAMDDLVPVQLLLHQLAEHAAKDDKYGEQSQDALVLLANQAIAATTSISAAIDCLGGLSAVGGNPGTAN